MAAATIHIFWCLSYNNIGLFVAAWNRLSLLQFQTKGMHLDQLCQTMTKLCGVTHHTGLCSARTTSTQMPTGFLLQLPLKQKESSLLCFLTSTVEFEKVFMFGLFSAFIQKKKKHFSLAHNKCFKISLSFFFLSSVIVHVTHGSGPKYAKSSAQMYIVHVLHKRN